MNNTIRYPAVAGSFYPAKAAQLRRQVQGFLDDSKITAGTPKAIIVPHAGYIYSGVVAASAYSHINAAAIRRVVLLGPSHRVRFRGVAASSAQVWRTPLGDVPIEACELPSLDVAHQQEHSLEVQLPFLQMVLAQFVLLPLVVGDADKESVAALLQTLWGGNDTLVVVSADLSHYQNYAVATDMDSRTSQAIVSLDSDVIQPDDTCGRIPVRGLLHLARTKRMSARLLDLRNSGDTAGDRDQVVGYGAYAFYDDQ